MSPIGRALRRARAFPQPIWKSAGFDLYLRQLRDEVVQWFSARIYPDTCAAFGSRMRLHKISLEDLESSFASEVIRRDGIFEQGIVARHDRDAGLGDEIILLVSFRVEADHGTFRDVDVAIDDGLLDLAVPAGVHMRKDDAVFHVGIRVHADVGREDGILHHTAGDDASRRDDGIYGRAGAS